MQYILGSCCSNKNVLREDASLEFDAPKPSRLKAVSTLADELSSPRAAQPVTEAEVLEVQRNWAAAIAKISSVYKEKGDYIKEAEKAAGELYAYGDSKVLFKPTKAAVYPFRPTGEEAMSYFVGGNAVEGGYDEDGGFAINGGKGWRKVVYNNHQIDLQGGIGLAMGEYYFECDTTGEETKVEYTFGYKRCKDGKVRIFLHHSSVPYKAGYVAAAPQYLAGGGLSVGA